MAEVDREVDLLALGNFWQVDLFLIFYCLKKLRLARSQVLFFGLDEIVTNLLAKFVPDLLFLLHEGSDEFVADVWRCVSVVGEAELLSDWRICVIAQLFRPAVFIEAFAIKYDERQKCSLPVASVYLAAKPVKIKCQNFIDFHFLAIHLCQIVVVS